MRLLKIDSHGELSLTKDLIDDVPLYAILSHTWGADDDEVTLDDLKDGSCKSKAGYSKIQFCGERAQKDGLRYFWVDTCCIKKSSDAELSQSLNSMFRWYQRAKKCYVHLSDVSTRIQDGRDKKMQDTCEQAFRESNWFTRGWTLQELLAPSVVEFFSVEHDLLGNKQSLESEISEITRIPISALRGCALSHFSIDEKFDWAKNRQTKREEDWAYSLLGIFEISMPVIYGEGKRNAVRRLRREIDDALMHEKYLRHLNMTEPRRIWHMDEVAPFTYHHLHSFVPSLVQQTHHAFLSSDRLLQQHLAYFYQRLTEHSAQLSELQTLIEKGAVLRDERPTTCSECGKRFPKGYDNHCAQLDKAYHLDPRSANIFFDCTSRFSQDISPASINRLSTNFAGSPPYILERNTFSHPQLYARGGLFNNRLFVLAMKQDSIQGQLTQQYYLLYAQTPRLWHRVIISATFRNLQDISAIPQVSAIDDNGTCKILPYAVNTKLEIELPRIKRFYSVTRITLDFSEEKSRQDIQKIWKVSQIKSFEDRREIEMSKEEEIQRDIDVMALTRFPESELEVVSQIDAACFTVKLDGQIWIERKIPFASARQDNENGLQEFIRDLKLLNSLQGSPGIPRLLGVIFDDAYVHLKGYLYEPPVIREIIRLFYIANSRSETIPWLIRLLWSKQIAQAMAEVHRRGLTMGIIVRHKLGLRVDGSPIFSQLTTSRSFLHRAYNKDIMPPELQSPHGNASQQMFSDRTDVFQLGHLLWLLAEHKGNTVGVRCSRNGCTNVPRFQCTAEHANPFNMPPCSDSVPSYFSDIITQCRSLNPNARPTARRIAEILSSRCELEVFPHDSFRLLETYDDNITFGTHCSECGEAALDRHHHCYVCDFGDFDLCPDCKNMGIPCRDLEHQMVERISRDGGFIHASQ